MLLSTRLRQVCVLSASAALIACGGGVTKEDKSPAIGQSEVSDQVTQSPTLTEAPLLETDETARWSHNERFCEADNKPDSAVIPQGPRQRVLPGV